LRESPIQGSPAISVQVLFASSDPKHGISEMFYRLGQWLLPRAMFKPFFPTPPVLS
jgi:hypothetical protein